MPDKRNFEGWELGFWNEETGEFVSLDDLSEEETCEFLGLSTTGAEILELVLMGLKLGSDRPKVQKKLS